MRRKKKPRRSGATRCQVGSGLSVNRLAWLRLRALYHLHRPQNPLPRRVTVQVALLKHDIGPHCGMDRRVLAVLLHEDLAGNGRALVDFSVRP